MKAELEVALPFFCACQTKIFISQEIAYTKIR